MTTYDTSTIALVAKATLGLSRMSNDELAAWSTFICHPDRPQDFGSLDGEFQMLAALEVKQEVDFRRGHRLGRGVFQGRSAHVARHLLGAQRCGPTDGPRVGDRV